MPLTPAEPSADPGRSHGSSRASSVGRLRSDLRNWRLFAVRILTSGSAVVLTVGLLPGLRFTSWRWGDFLLIGIVFGLLNAVVKPVIQFFTLRYLVASYGLVVVLINALMLALLSTILGGQIEKRGLLALLAGGLVVGFVGLVLDTLAGTSPPLLDRTADQATAWEQGPPPVSAAGPSTEGSAVVPPDSVAPVEVAVVPAAADVDPRPLDLPASEASGAPVAKEGV